MLCDYAILIVNSNILTVLYRSKIKYDAAKFFIEYFLHEHSINENNFLYFINSRGYVGFYENGTLIIMCKIWDSICYECDKIDLTYRVRRSSKLCRECTHKYLKEVLQNPSSKGFLSKEEFIENLKVV